MEEEDQKVNHNVSSLIKKSRYRYRPSFSRLREKLVPENVRAGLAKSPQTDLETASRTR